MYELSVYAISPDLWRWEVRCGGALLRCGTAPTRDDAAMRVAVDHANRVKGTTYPNPPVGAVILDRDGEVAGAGAPEPPGGPHAVAGQSYVPV